MSFHVPNQWRIRSGRLGSEDAWGNNGLFIFNHGPVLLRVIASDFEGWDHVSVSIEKRCPTWDEMCAVKDLFWDEEDCVLQFHPPRSQYVNLHPYCLHLWRPTMFTVEMPPRSMVG